MTDKGKTSNSLRKQPGIRHLCSSPPTPWQENSGTGIRVFNMPVWRCLIPKEFWDMTSLFKPTHSLSGKFRYEIIIPVWRCCIPEGFERFGISKIWHLCSSSPTPCQKNSGIRALWKNGFSVSQKDTKDMASQFDVARKFTYCEKNSGIRVLYQNGDAIS